MCVHINKFLNNRPHRAAVAGREIENGKYFSSESAEPDNTNYLNIDFHKICINNSSAVSNLCAIIIIIVESSVWPQMRKYRT